MSTDLQREVSINMINSYKNLDFPETSATTPSDADDMSVRLEKGIKLGDLLDNKEVELIVAENQEGNVEEEDDNRYFEPEDVYQNVFHGDEEDSPTDEDNATPFERMARKMVDLTGDEGVMKKVLKPGAGSVVVHGALVRVHYNGYLEYGDEPFDSSRLRKSIKKFRLGEGEVLTGFDVAVQSMKKGELSRFLLQPDYAYGPMGCPPRIPADATLMYQIELLSFVEKEGVDDFYSMTEEERRNLSFAQLKKVCNSEKQEGNEYYNNKLYRRAIGKYRLAVRVLEDAHLKDHQEEKEQKKMLLKLYLNLALCCEKIGEIRHAIFNCSRAYRIDKHNVKVLYHYGKSLRLNSEFPKARDFLIKARNLEPSNKDINRELRVLDQSVSYFHQEEKATCRRMFSKFTGDSDDKTKDGETNKENESVEECSPEFRKSVYEKLREFKEDSCATEMPLTMSKLSPPEIQCILEVSMELGIDAIQRGTGETTHLVVRKKSSDKKT